MSGFSAEWVASEYRRLYTPSSTPCSTPCNALSNAPSNPHPIHPPISYPPPHSPSPHPTPQAPTPHPPPNLSHPFPPNPSPPLTPPTPLGVRLATKHERHFSAEQMAVSRAMPTILNLGSSRDRHINTVTGKMGNRSMSFDTAGRSVAFGRVAAVKSTPPMHLRPSVAATENVPTNVVRHVPTHALPRSLSFPVKQQLAPGAVRTSAPPVKPRRDSTQSICSRSGLSSPLSGVAPPPIPSPPPHAYAPVYTAPQVYTEPPPLPVALPSSADTELESPVPVGPEMAPYVPPPALVETSEPFAIEPESLSSLRAPESPAKDAADTPPNRPTPSIAEPLTQGTPARATAQVDDSQAVAAAFETATADETVGHLPPLFGKKVAFIGLGPMCSHAAALLTAGAALAVFDIRNMNAIESLVEKGARAATSPR